MILLILGFLSIIFLWAEHTRWENKRNNAGPLSSWDKMSDDEKFAHYEKTIAQQIQDRQNKLQ